MEELEKIAIKRIIGPTPQGAAVLVGNERKTFAVFVGPYEAAAMVREINKEKLPRPLTHELMQNIFVGFDVKVKKVIVSDLADQTYFATLVLEQQLRTSDGKLSGQRSEVRIDARPSDCFVLALKNGTDIFVTKEVFAQVEDVADQPAQFFGLGAPSQEADEPGVEIPDALGDELEKALGDEEPGAGEHEDENEDDGEKDKET